jgi:protein-tyrosine phosphatase/predicted kinase
MTSECSKYIQEHEKDDISAVVVGLSKIEKGDVTSWYAAIYCPWAQNLRKAIGLASAEYHITLGWVKADLHGLPSLYNSMIRWEHSLGIWTDLVTMIITSTNSAALSETSPEWTILHRARDVFAVKTALTTEQIKPLREIATWCLRGGHAHQSPWSGLALDIGFMLIGNGIPYGLQIVLACRPLANTTADFEGLMPVTLAAGGSLAAKTKVIRDCNVTLLNRMKDTSKSWASRARIFGISLQSLCCLNLQRNFSFVTLEGDERLQARCDSDSKRYLPYLLAGSAIPTAPVHVRAMSGLGIRHIITVHESPLPTTVCPTVPVTAALAFEQTSANSSSDIVSYHYFVVDRTPPSSEQLRSMCALIHAAVCKSEGVLVHCQGGVGRTNTVIIAYLMWAQNLSAAEATARVTAQRNIILSESQKNALQRWWKECNERRAFESAALDTPPAPVPVPTRTTLLSAPTDVPAVAAVPAVPAVPGAQYRKIASVLNMPPLIVLCGFAASGKSSFSKAMVQHTDYFVRINKDEMRGKSQCENTFFDAMSAMSRGKSGRGRVSKPGEISGETGAVVIDCCNLDEAKRSLWLQLAHNPRAWCVFFDIPLEECKARILTRSGHPTIQSGPAGVRILDSMHKMLQPPSPETAHKEGFERVIVIKSGAEANALLRSWKIPEVQLPTSASEEDVCSTPEEVSESESADDGECDSLLKFPRTSHIMNLGAATRDDKVLGPTDIAALVGPGRRIIVEEKLDGANMGIFINKADSRILAQNRSHFISSKYHPQFAPLDHWIALHTAELWSLLTPGRHILYGEWLYATHSVKYTRLPAWFVAYDLYDRMTKTFASRETLAALLATTTIPHVPLIYQGSVESVEQLMALVDGGSAFNDKKREGVVVRVCEGDRLISRAKLVRSDFIAGNERWNKSSKLEVNSLAHGVH